MSVVPTREATPQIVRSAQRPVRSAGGGAQSGLTGRDVMRILRKRFWLILLCVIFFTALGIGGHFLWERYAPSYTASAFLSFRPPSADPLGGGTRQYQADAMERWINSHAEMVKTEGVLRQALDEDDDLQKTNWYRRTSPEQMLVELEEMVTVAPVRDTTWIRIAVSDQAKADQDRKDLAIIANSIGEAAVEISRSETSAESQREIDQLREERTGLDLQRKRVTEEIASIRANQQVSTLRERRNTLATRLESYTRLIIQLEQQVQQARAAVAELDQIDLDSAREVADAINQDSLVHSLRVTKVNLETEYDNLLRKFGPGHPSVKSIRNRLASVEKQLAEREKTIKDDAKAQIRDARVGMRDALVAQLAEAQERYNEADTRAQDVQQTLETLERLEAQRDELTDRIRKIDDGTMSRRLALKQYDPLNLKVRAVKPREPSWPRLEVLVPLGVLLGLVSGLGLAFLLEFVDTSVKNPGDVSRKLDLPLLGMVPHLDDVEDDIDDMRLAFLTNPNSLVGEAFRQVRTTLLFSGPPEQRRSLLVTSAMPEDGRGTVTLNLAASIARGGKKVLVIDANFRQPMIKDLFPQTPEAGLSSALVGESDWRELVREIEPNFSVMPAGPMPPNPGELLGSDRMVKLIEEFKGEFDQILFDGAPVLVVTDPAILSSIVDGTVMVVRAGVNTYGVVGRARDMIDRVGGHVIGAVLNGVRVTAGGYLRKNYDTFYEYHEQAKLPGK